MDRSTVFSLFVSNILPPLLTAIGGGLAWVLMQLALWIRAKWGATKTGALLTQLTFLAEVAVQEVETKLRPLVKEYAVDGRIGAVEAEKLRRAAADILIELAKNKGFEEAQKAIEVMAPEVSTLLGGIIERAVRHLPPSKPVASLNVQLTGAANP